MAEFNVARIRLIVVGGAGESNADAFALARYLV